MNQIHAKVERVERLGVTYYGNPMHSVTLRLPDNTTETRRISNNASLNYAITNPEYREQWHTFYLTRAGRIAYARII